MRACDAQRIRCADRIRRLPIRVPTHCPSGRGPTRPCQATRTPTTPCITTVRAPAALQLCLYCVHVLNYANCSRHTAEEVELWKKITAVGSLMVAGVFLNWLASDHHHMHTPPAYPYLRIRNKPLPWGDGTKDLLDARDTYVDDHDHHGHH